uniref:DUF19 domain-containing protein n=1 Tax=Panagrellus redivivus TaxID=6233 RepID=A0A7E4W9Q5_PANRE
MLLPILVILALIVPLIESQVDSDDSCGPLKPEFMSMCLHPPDEKIKAETIAFCEAYVEMCPATISKLNLKKGSESKKYCKKHRERFRYVCPDPTRFGKYRIAAIEFCTRFSENCRGEEIPTEPEMFKIKESRHIYIKEHQYFCDLEDEWAKTYCFNPVILKIPKVQFVCYLYKIHCIDPQTQVIYG